MKRGIVFFVAIFCILGVTLAQASTPYPYRTLKKVHHFRYKGAPYVQSNAQARQSTIVLSKAVHRGVVQERAESKGKISKKGTPSSVISKAVHRRK